MAAVVGKGWRRRGMLTWLLWLFKGGGERETGLVAVVVVEKDSRECGGRGRPGGLFLEPHPDRTDHIIPKSIIPAGMQNRTESHGLS